jgi:hypothetical protein
VEQPAASDPLVRSGAARALEIVRRRARAELRVEGEGGVPAPAVAFGAWLEPRLDSLGAAGQFRVAS